MDQGKPVTSFAEQLLAKVNKKILYLNGYDVREDLVKPNALRIAQMLGDYEA